MRVCVFGGTGVIGRMLLPLLLQDGHHVIAPCRNPEKISLLNNMGIQGEVLESLEQNDLRAFLIRTNPDVIINQLTALNRPINTRYLDRCLKETNWLRTVISERLLHIAISTGVRRYITQSLCGWPNARNGAWVIDETYPLAENVPKQFSGTLAAIKKQEDLVKNCSAIQALALRYGTFYGPGTAFHPDGEIGQLIKKRQFPLVGNANAYWSFIHVRDAARATVAAVNNNETGIINIVDDDPAPVSDWLPYYAQVLGANNPRHMPTWLAKLFIGSGGVMLMTEARAGLNAKAKKTLQWEPIYSSWRQGFVHMNKCGQVDPSAA